MGLREQYMQQRCRCPTASEVKEGVEVGKMHLHGPLRADVQRRGGDLEECNGVQAMWALLSGFILRKCSHSRTSSTLDLHGLRMLTCTAKRIIQDMKQTPPFLGCSTAHAHLLATQHSACPLSQSQMNIPLPAAAVQHLV